MARLTREQILNAQDYKKEEVDMTSFGWPGSVFVQSMTGLERGAFEAAIQDQGNLAKFRAILLVSCIVDESGEKLFNEADIDALNSKSAAALDFLYDKAQALSRFKPEDVKGLTKNSSAGQSAGSTSA